ncbi:TolC family protein [Salinibacter altiplanensis]|uniref:TolC family protein n=1 Tax=Salinibacter altiplanensis TaxID=1803181 RepID=UPI000C9FF45B|nr:TolC family protein [Salinibacter altiplanensis]
MDSLTFLARLSADHWRPGTASVSWGRVLAVVLLGSVLGALSRSHPQAAAQPAPEADVEVGFVLSDSSRAHRQAAETIRREVRSLVGPERRVRFPERYRRVLSASDSTALGRLADDGPGPAVIIAVGLSASHRLSLKSTRSVPVVAAHVLDPGLQGIPMADDASGAANLTYVTEPGLVRENMDLLRSLAPASAPALLVPARMIEGAPALAEQMRDRLERRDSSNVSWRVVPARSTAEATLNALPPDTDAAYLATPLPLSSVEQDRLISGLRTRQIPTAVHRGRELVDRGALATASAPSADPISRRVALHAVDLFRGAAAESLSVKLPSPRTPYVNESTARGLGFSVPSDLRLRATLTGTPTPASTDSMTYAQAVRRGVGANHELSARRSGLAATRENVRVERADLLPQVQAGARARQVDADQAAASFGAQPERALSGSVSFSQTLFSPRDVGDLEIAKRQRAAGAADVERSEQDVALQVSSAYVSVLQARALAEVRRGDLALSRENLSLARAQEESGQAGRQQVLRFKTQAAQARRTVLDAEARVEVARARLAQVLARSPEGLAGVAGLSPSASVLTLPESVFAEHGHTPSARQRLTDFLLEEGVSNAPALQALDEQIAAARRGVEAGQQSYWAPTVALEGQLNSRVLEGGAGTESISLPGGPAGAAIPQTPSTTWNVGLSLSLPLFTGLQRDAQIEQGRARLSQLTAQRREVRSSLEERIRARTEQATAGYLSLREAEAGRRTAQETIELVQDSYTAGAADVLDLLDAQEAVLDARLAEVDARYSFLLRLLQTERAISRTGPLQTADERAAVRERLRAFMKDGR